MPQSAREGLSEAIKLFGHDGQLVVFKDSGDPLGTTAEGANPPPYSGTEGPRPKLREKVAEANARSRGELL